MRARKIGVASTTLSIKNAPDALVNRLRHRATRNHRSLQDELMDNIEEAAREPVSAEELEASWQNARSLNSSQDVPSPVEIVRAMRGAQ